MCGPSDVSPSTLHPDTAGLRESVSLDVTGPCFWSRTPQKEGKSFGGSATKPGLDPDELPYLLTTYLLTGDGPKRDGQKYRPKETRRSDKMFCVTISAPDSVVVVF